MLAVMISDKEKPTDVDEALAAIARHGISTVPVPRQVCSPGLMLDDKFYDTTT